MPQTDMEYKACDLSIKLLDDDATDGTFEGYASTFKNADLQRDVVMPGAFVRTIKQTKGRVPFLMAHSLAQVIGFGTDAHEDDKGLFVRGVFNLESTAGKDAYSTAKLGQKLKQPVGLSIGYSIPADGAQYDAGKDIRRLLDIDLWEYSMAAVPANERARLIGIKAAGCESIRDYEQFLREAGLSREQAKRFIAAHVTGGLPQRDADAGHADTRSSQQFRSDLRDLKTYLIMTGV